MPFILSEQRGEHGAFDRYREYLASVEGLMPPGAHALASSDWWYSFEDHRAPHDAWLEQAIVGEADAGDRRRVVSVTLRLLGPYHDGHIELRYRDVSRYRMELTSTPGSGFRGHGDWRYDELRLAPGGRVEHEIEWYWASPTATWLIEAADVDYRWVPSDANAPAAVAIP